jgi:uncharacterized protein (DUF433 family)
MFYHDIILAMRFAVHSDPEILGGTPVFVGTRVPFQALVDYVEGGETIDTFLDHFPSVSRQQVHLALEQAKDLLCEAGRK